MLYPSAKIIIKHPSDKDKILLVKRYIGDKVYYEPAGGKLEVDFNKKVAENFEKCAIREAREELGLVVSIEKYIGSFFFFWTIDSGKCSSCALFIGSIIEKDLNFRANSDSCESPIEPVWVSLDDIVKKKINIESTYVGLEDLIINYFFPITKI